MNFLHFPCFILVIFSAAAALSAENVPIDFEASKVFWLAKKITAEHSGTVNLSRGELQITDGKIAGGSFEVDMTTIIDLDLPEPGLRKKIVYQLKSDDFFSVDQFPSASFKIESLKKSGGDTYRVGGGMTIKGKTHPVEFDALIKLQGGKWTFDATLELDRTKWDVKYRSGKFFENLGDQLIYDIFKITVKLVSK